MVALIDMVRPERRIHQLHVLNRHIPTVGDIGQTRTLGILVGTLGVPLTTNPKLLPIVQSIAIDNAVAGDGKAIQSVGIHQCAEVSTSFALDTCLHPGEINNTVGAFQFSNHMQVRTPLKKQSTREVCTLRNHHDAPTLLRATVNHSLDFLGLHDG